MQKKIIEIGSKAVDKFITGIRKMDALVGGTIGPAGRNRIIYRNYRAPLVTNDGVTIARHAYLEDEMEDLAAQTLVEIALKTNDRAGDGTTSCIVEACALVESGLKKIAKANKHSALGGGRMSEMQFARDVRKALPEALAILEKQRADLAEDDLYNVISTSLENMEFSKTLAELVQQVGKDGYIAVEDNWATKYGIDTEVSKGMRFRGSYASPYLTSSEDQKEAIWADTAVLVTNQHLESISQIQKVLKVMQDPNQHKGARRLVIIGGFSEGASPFSKHVIATIATSMQAAMKGADIVQVLLVKAPTLTSEELEDVAVYCNAKFIDKNLDMQLEDVEMVHLGSAKKIVADEDDVTIVEGAGDPTQRIEMLKEQNEREKDQMFEEKMKRRIASLSSGVGIIRVGAFTESERTYMKHKIEDAVNAAKAAMEEGVVQGGGLALKFVADSLGENHILYDALMAPFRRIRENAGVDDMEVGPEVLDSYKVVRVGLENACSAAALLITCDAGIAERRQTLFDMWEKKMVNRDEKNDFRDAENQDYGRGRPID
jgi:chaperonin GroEL